MTAGSIEYEWGAFCDGVIGASHQRSGLPSQDSYDWYPKQLGRFGSSVVMIVSDGHGSAKCFRSGDGSKIATKRTKDTIKNLLHRSEFINSDLSTIKRQLDERLPRDLVQNWINAVDQELSEKPFKDEEFTRLEAKEGPLASKKVREHPRLAYGATLLIVFISQTFIHILQLGDGDILTVSDNGEVSRPLPKDDRLIANETTSLSQDFAWQEFRSSFIPLAGSPPALILVSSDGYSNSFRDEEGFLSVGRDILYMIRTDGPKIVRCNLREWLREASQSGSGDDISLGVIYRKDAVQPIELHDLSAIEAEAKNCLDVPLEDISKP
jgi:serine/threonine protein phosphatase PrpC